MFPTPREGTASLSALAGVGVGLVVLAVVHAVFLATTHGTDGLLLDVLLLGLPGLGVLALARRTVGDVDEDCRSRVLAWAVGGGLGLLAFAWLVLTALGSALWDHDALFVYNAGLSVGAFVGGFVGVQEARSLTRSREVAFTQSQRDRLEYLNHLLRHDLLNTLAVIQGHAEVLAEDATPEVADRLETIRRQTDGAVELIRNVRVLVATTRGEPALEPVLLSDVVEREVASLLEAYPSATATADVPPGVAVRADDLLGSVFENLVRNAIQHNDADRPAVTVTVEVGDETVATTVADDGPGLPAHVREDPFSPAEDGDHGFGLFLVRSLVDRYGGRVEVVETGPEGTAVQVVLQRAEPPGTGASRHVGT